MTASALITLLTDFVRVHGDHEVRFPCRLLGSREIRAVEYQPTPEPPERKNNKVPVPAGRDPRYMLLDQQLIPPSKGLRP